MQFHHAHTALEMSTTLHRTVAHYIRMRHMWQKGQIPQKRHGELALVFSYGMYGEKPQANKCSSLTRYQLHQEWRCNAHNQHPTTSAAELTPRQQHML